MDSSPGPSSASPSGTQRTRDETPSLATSGSHYSQSSYAPSRPFGVPTHSSVVPRNDAASPTSRPASLRRSSGRVFVERTPATELDVPFPRDNEGPSTSTVDGSPNSTVHQSNPTPVFITQPPGSTREQQRIESSTSVPPEHLAARFHSIEGDARFLHSERAILLAARAILHSERAALYGEPAILHSPRAILHGERAVLHGAGDTVVKVDEDILVDMSDVSTYTEGPELDLPYTDAELLENPRYIDREGEAYDDDADDTEDEAFFDAYEEIAESDMDQPEESDSDQPGSRFSADSATSHMSSPPPPRPAERPSTIPSVLLRAMADLSAGLPKESETTSYSGRWPSVNGPAQHTHRSPQGMPTPPTSTDRGSLGAEEVAPQPAPPSRSPQPAGRSCPQPAEGSLSQAAGGFPRRHAGAGNSLHRPRPPSLASLEHLLTPRNSIAHMRAAGRPALEPLRAPYKFELRTVPAGTKQVLHDVQYGAPDVAERAGLRYGVHGANYLASDDWAMKKRQLEDIGRLVHSTRTVLHKYRYITLTVDSDAKRKDTAEWLDWVRLVKSTCDELMRKFRDFDNLHLWAPDYLSKRKERLARYEQQIIKTTEAIIKHTLREQSNTYEEDRSAFEEAHAVWHERKRVYSENTRALKEDMEEFRMMRPIFEEEEERATRRRSLYL
ncbi:hypothetical protein FB107DRAFT_245982 [Schizophyllum commune]